MKKLLLAVLAICMILPMASLPVCADGPPAHVEGTWLYLPYVIDIRIAGSNTFLELYEEGWWDGGFSGTSDDYGTAVWHTSDLWTFTALVYFEGEVNGVSVTMVMSVNGSKPTSLSEWQGRWVIVSGAGELETLRGQGNWWGLGWLGDPDVPGVISYDGQVHFAP